MFKKPPFEITPQILAKIQDIFLILGRMEQNSFKVRSDIKLRKDNSIRSIKSSVAIEGNSLSLDQVTDILNGQKIIAPQCDSTQLVYYRDFWATQPYEQINSIDIAEKVFGLSVESGTEIAHTLLQRALRSVKNPVQENGKLDKVTLIAINSANPDALIAAFRSEIAGHYRTSFEHTHIKDDVAELMLKHAYA